MSGRSGEGGGVPVEFAAAAGVLLLPIAILVLSLPTWLELRTVASVAAQEAAREAVLADTADAATVAGRAMVATIAVNHGLDRGALALCYAADGDPCAERVASLERGDAVTTRVTVDLPALNFPLLGAALHAVPYTASHTEHVDRYRSFDP